jgi:hypothetical protein
MSPARWSKISLPIKGLSNCRIKEVIGMRALSQKADPATSQLPNDRIFTTVLTLNTKVLDTVLKLKVFDKEDLLNPLIEESVKNNTLIERDF